MALNNLRINSQILLIVLFSLFSFVITGGLYGYSQHTANEKSSMSELMIHAKTLNDEIRYGFLNARRNEKDFLLRLDEASIKKHDSTSEHIHSKLKELRLRMVALGLPQTEIDKVEAGYDKYNEQFSAVIKFWRQIGLTPAEGLQGELHQAVDNVEQKIKNVNDPKLTIIMMQMRQSEKDYFITGEYKFIKQLDKNYRAFLSEIASQGLDAATAQNVTDSLKIYVEKFHVVSDLRDNIGVQTKKLSTTFAEVEPILEGFSKDMDERTIKAKEEAKISAEQSFQLMVGTQVFAAIFVCVLSIAVGRGISRSISSLAVIMKRLADGDLNVVVPFNDRTNEIGQISRAVDVFKDNMQETEAMRVMQDELEAQSKIEKKQAMQSLADNFEGRISNIIKSVATAAIEMQATAQKMTFASNSTTKISQVVATAAAEADENVQTVANAARELSTSSEEIAHQISSVAQKAERASMEAEITSSQVNELNALADSIEEVVDAIKDIAEQTNLLALNATIEAARAGEAGKGFAVVADEVKKLATETANKTVQIDSRVERIQTAIRQSVEAVQRIIGDVRDISQATGNVANAVDEQNQATNEIGRSVAEASTGTQRVASNIVEVQKNAEETGRSASSLNLSAKGLSETATFLQRETQGFLSEVREG